MAKKVMFWLIVGLMVVGVVGMCWGAVTADDLLKEITNLKIEVAGMKGEFKAALAYLDWKLNLLIALVVAVLGFIFYMAREIGVGTREKVEKIPRLEQSIEGIKEFLEQVADKLQLPHLPRGALFFLSLFTVYCLLLTPVWAAVPAYINIQGRVTDATGSPLTSMTVEFKINGTSYGTATTNPNGIFNAVLGPFDPSTFSETSVDIYVGDRKVGSQPFNSVPYAFRAAVAESLPGVTVKDGNVGIGTTNPVAKLDVRANYLQGSTPPDLLKLSTSLFREISNKLIVKGNGYVGIGTTEPSATLEVQGTFATGYNAKATAAYSTAMGGDTTASNFYSTAMGVSTIASGFASTAMGYKTTAGGDGSTAMGSSIVVNGRNSFGIGLNNITMTITKESTMAIVGGYVGVGTTEPQEQLHVVGNLKVDGNIIGGGGANAWNVSGSNIYNTNTGKVGIGTTEPSATLEVRGTFAAGYNAKATGRYSTAMGYQTTASGLASTAMGWFTTASNGYSTAMGYQTTASGLASTAMGNYTTASGFASTAMGNSTTASGLASTAMGYQTTASGLASTAMGWFTTASGECSTAMGRYTTAEGAYSTAMGNSIVVEGTNSFGIGLDNRFRKITNPNTMAIVGGNVGIGTTTPSYLLDVNGMISCQTLYQSSDARWKKNIETIPSALDRVAQLRGVSFEWRQDEYKDMNFDSKRHLGLIAQEVEKVFPELVSTDQNGYKNLEYANLTAALVEAIKELKAQNDTLKAKNDELEARVRALETKLNQ